MTKEDFKCFLIQKIIEETGDYPTEEDKAKIQDLVDFAFNGV